MSIYSFEDAEKAFIDFVKMNHDNPVFKNKYVVFVGSTLFSIGEHQPELVKLVYAKFGNIACYCGKVTLESEVHLIEETEAS